MADEKHVHVKINSPEKIIWEGEAESVTSENSQGPFDILPMHSNFISIIENKPITVKVDGKVETYTFALAVIYAHSNTVYIYTNF